MVKNYQYKNEFKKRGASEKLLKFINKYIQNIFLVPQVLAVSVPLVN